MSKDITLQEAKSAIKGKEREIFAFINLKIQELNTLSIDISSMHIHLADVSTHERKEHVVSNVSLNIEF